LAEVESEIVRRGPELAPLIEALSGLRVLAPADAEETLFSFLCTPNNNLERITRMVRVLAEYGEPIAEVEMKTIFRFPNAERVAAIPESELRGRGFGYRGRSIPNVARQLLTKGPGWLDDLKSAPHAEAHAELCCLDGVGPKLADCVCLFGLGHLEAAPVDTHLYQAACRLYFPELKGKPLTDARYRLIGGFLRDRFGELTGWAHQYLFYDNLLRWRRRA
jgi:N-glycosylase/DNA lyase